MVFQFSAKVQKKTRLQEIYSANGSYFSVKKMVSVGSELKFIAYTDDVATAVVIAKERRIVIS